MHSVKIFKKKELFSVNLKEKKSFVNKRTFNQALILLIYYFSIQFSTEYNKKLSRPNINSTKKLYFQNKKIENIQLILWLINLSISSDRNIT